jgi:hypothetical protein
MTVNRTDIRHLVEFSWTFGLEVEYEPGGNGHFAGLPLAALFQPPCEAQSWPVNHSKVNETNVILA